LAGGPEFIGKFWEGNRPENHIIDDGRVIGMAHERTKMPFQEFFWDRESAAYHISW
jgi:hypothetical protein